MAVVTKLNLALYQYNISLRHLQQSREVKTIDSEIAKHTRYAAISSAASAIESEKLVFKIASSPSPKQRAIFVIFLYPVRVAGFEEALIVL